MDIFNDGSLMAIHTPGHSAGHTSYLLSTTDGTILLTGDASHTKYGFLNNIEPGWADDEQVATESLNQLRIFAANFPDVSIIYGHQK
jgi:glyoxylase-like metal-dependent hydrolase (beta-lactamase superfamily II)